MEQRLIDANLVSLGTLADIGLVFFRQCFMHLTCTGSCRHAYILCGFPQLMGRLDAGNPPFTATSFARFPLSPYRSAKVTPSVAILTQLGKMENS